MSESSDKNNAADFLDWLESEYDWLFDEDKFKQESCRRGHEGVKDLHAIRGVLMILPVLEDAVNEIVGLATVSTEEADKFEKAVMSDPEGREVVERLYRQRPYLFSGVFGGRAMLS